MDKKTSGVANGVYQKPDISEVEALSAQLLTANQRLEELNERLSRSEKARSEMLANLSHDLRAPLTALRSAVDCLQSKPHAPVEEREAMLAVMDRRCATLEHMTENLFLLVSMELSAFSLHKLPLELAPFLEEYFAMQQMNEAYGARDLKWEVPYRFAGMVEADPKQLVRVLDNLFSNALKFTRPGDEIALGCRWANPKPEIELFVRDSGVGIPNDKLEVIFERTYTLSPARTPP